MNKYIHTYKHTEISLKPSIAQQLSLHSSFFWCLVTNWYHVFCLLNTCTYIFHFRDQAQGAVPPLFSFYSSMKSPEAKQNMNGALLKKIIWISFLSSINKNPSNFHLHGLQFIIQLVLHFSVRQKLHWPIGLAPLNYRSTQGHYHHDVGSLGKQSGKEFA